MKAVGYIQPSPVSNPHGLLDLDVPVPVPGPQDLLIAVKAVSVNPVDYKIRTTRAGTQNEPVILGWDAAGVVTQVGAAVQGFAVGDAVYYAGAVDRPGSNAEYQAVDYRLVAHKPAQLSFNEAAALPLTSITAIEMLYEQLEIPPEEPFDILIIGGGGGVSSAAIQLIKLLTKGRVYVTSGSSASREWLELLKVDGILDRSKPLVEEMQRLGLPYFDYIFSTTHTAEYLDQMLAIIRPFGGIGVIDDLASLDIMPFKQKSVRFAWEYMFAKAVHGYKMETQGLILQNIAKLVDTGGLLSTVNILMRGLSASNVQIAHQLLNDAHTVGKIVIEVAPA